MEAFQSTTVIIIDDYVEPEDDDSLSILSPHDQKCIKIRNFFTRYTKAKVIGVTVPKDSHVRVAYDQIVAAVKGKTRRDQVVVYYDGKAGIAGERYSWKFHGNSYGWFNAYDFIKRLGESEANCFFLLDAWINTRIGSAWKQAFKNCEVIASGPGAQDPDGEAIMLQTSFTLRMIADLIAYIKKHGQDARNRSSAVHTIPQIMAADETLISNPVRPVRKGSKVVFSPRDLRENKGTELRFFAQDPVVPSSVVIAQPVLVAETVAPQDSLFCGRSDDDEGYVGGDGEYPYGN